jgi:hypothetical protein
MKISRGEDDDQGNGFSMIKTGHVAQKRVSCIIYSNFMLICELSHELQIKYNFYNRFLCLNTTKHFQIKKKMCFANSFPSLILILMIWRFFQFFTWTFDELPIFVCVSIHGLF